MNNITNNTIVVQHNFPHPNDEKPQKFITYQSLQEGDIFDKDIKRIMAIINGVEQEFNEKKVTKNFQSALTTAVHRRHAKQQHEEILKHSMRSRSKSKRDHAAMPSTFATAFAKDFN